MIVIQSLVIVAVAFAAGASVSAESVVTMLVVAVLLGGGITALSDALALVTRQEETLIGAVQFVALPLTSLSSGMMASNLLPGWIRDVARLNPVNWTVVVARSVISPSRDWSLVGLRVGLLVGVLLVAGALSTRAFRVYQRAA